MLLAALLLSIGISVALLLSSSRETVPGSYLTGREADAAHLLMNAGMAWMVTSWFGPGARSVLIALLGVLAAAFVAALVVGGLRSGGYWHAQRPVSAYHLFAAVTMLYATVAMPVMSTEMSDDMSGMDGMSGMHDMSGMAGMPDAAWSPSTLAWILAAIFALDALATAVVVLFFPAAALAGQPTGDAGTAAEGIGRGRLRASAVPHVVMDVAMVVMLVVGR